MRRIILYLFCFFIIGCINKAKQKKSPPTSINNTIGVNDTFGLSLHSEHPIYSTKQKQVTFILHNNSNADIGVGRGYSYTYEDKKGVWRNVPMQLVVFEEEIVIRKGDRYDVDARLFQHIPGRYRFFYTVRICGKEHITMMTEFTLSNKMDSISKSAPIPIEGEHEQPSFVLQPVPRNIPTGEAISPALLSMQTEYDYYPPSTTKVKLTVTNHSQQEYTCGNDYSLAYYNNDKQQWEILPTDPVIEDIGWILQPEYSSHEQIIKLYTSEVPNRAGKYRIYKAFNRNAKVTYAEFELVDEAGAKRLRGQMNAAWNGKTISSQNIYGSYMRGDSIFVDLINNSIHFQKLFRKEMLNYSAINYGVVREPSPFIQRAYTDTLQINMKTEKSVYPIGTESVNVILTNKNLSQQNLFFGESYFVARKQGEQWIPLHDNSLVHDIGIILKPDGDYHFKAKLYPLFNENTSGQYRVYKEVKFDGTNRKWYMAAEFKIE